MGVRIEMTQKSMRKEEIDTKAGKENIIDWIWEITAF